jgi:N-acetylglucosamine kinase-like BadF-type ATPase
MKTVIIDSGGTSSDWAVLENAQLLDRFVTEGMHPIKDNLPSIVEEAFNKHSSVNESAIIHFYGAGTSSEQLIDKIRRAFDNHITPNTQLHIESDLLAAARALCGSERGIVCILGTGSNSALYDGQQLTKSIASGGYLLGDEGSGYHLSKTLIINYLRNNLSAESTASIKTYLNKKQIDLINAIYTSKKVNATIASFSTLLSQITETDRHNCVVPCFEEFIQKRILPIYETDIGLYFTGSISFHFKKELEEALKTVNLQLLKLEPKPIEALIKYHIENL